MLPGVAWTSARQGGGDRPIERLHRVGESRSEIRQHEHRARTIRQCPELAKEVIRVINISRLQSSYRLRFGPDGLSLEWLATDDQGEVVLSEEPEVTLFMRLRNMLLAPFVPEQLL